MFVRNGYIIYRDEETWCVRYNRAAFDILRVKRFYTMKDAIDYVDAQT